MGNKLYVGNLAYSVRDEQLNTIFAGSGEVLSAKVVMDRDTGRSKGFGFVEMSSADAAQKAIADLDGKDVDGRPLRVSEAKPRENSGPRQGGFRPREGGPRRDGGFRGGNRF